jgi:hypothetical protein
MTILCIFGDRKGRPEWRTLASVESIGFLHTPCFCSITTDYSPQPQLVRSHCAAGSATQMRLQKCTWTLPSLFLLGFQLSVWVSTFARGTPERFLPASFLFSWIRLCTVGDTAFPSLFYGCAYMGCSRLNSRMCIRTEIQVWQHRRRWNIYRVFIFCIVHSRTWIYYRRS